jgi:glycosyltransferase involved in cell wall biosynthesis
VHRGAIYPSHDSRPAHRAANYLSFAASGAAVALAKLHSTDVVFVYSTPATAAVPALATQALRRLPFVVQIQDLWPQTVTSSGLLDEGREGRVERALHRYCDAVYARADTVAVTSPGMADLIAMRGVTRDKLEFVPNWADESAFRPVPADPRLAAELGPFRPFTVMYAGNFGELQSLETVVEAAAIVRNRTDIGFALVGAGVTEARLRRMVDDLRLDNVQFVPPQPFTRMAKVLALGDVQLVSLRDVPLFQSTLPSKLQANLAAGRPVIGAVTGDAARVITEAGAGHVTKPGSAGELADAVLRLVALSPAQRTALGAGSREYYRANFSEKVVGDRLSDLLVGAARRQTHG